MRWWRLGVWKRRRFWTFQTCVAPRRIPVTPLRCSTVFWELDRTTVGGRRTIVVVQWHNNHKTINLRVLSSYVQITAMWRAVTVLRIDATTTISRLDLWAQTEIPTATSRGNSGDTGNAGCVRTIFFWFFNSSFTPRDEREILK